MSLEAEINAYFVKTRSSESESEDFKTAASVLSSHIHENAIRHIKASEGYPLIASGQLTKRDVFIFDHFEGDFFKQLQQTKALIVGSRCLLVCILKNEPIPYGKSPVYTTAMRDLKISASGITPQEKDQLSIKIQWMGGYYLQNFGRCVTHLISNTIKSSKYEHATLNGIPVMHIDWVQRVWERSLVDYISATDEEFDKYRLPIFFDANITSTGLTTAKKDEIMRLVQENGGTYHRAFRSQLVDIVITEKGKTDSEKFQAAQRLKKDILTTDWIFDSVQKGFALPIKDYQVKLLKASTPTKSDQSMADFTSTDHTQLSEISRIATPLGVKKPNSDITVNDTICSNLNETQQQQPRNETFQAPQPVGASTRNSIKNLQRDVLLKNVDNIGSAHYQLILEEISPREAKKAGTFLDGCCIYLSGFRAAEKEKLNRILNAGGATRYDAINDEITHVIVGQLSEVESKAWKKDGLRTNSHIVRLDWLLESIRLKQTANENVYRVSLPCSREPDAPSPSSKKTLRSMNHSFKQPNLPTKKKLFQHDNENEKETDIEVENQRVSMSSEASGIILPRACSTELPMEEDEHDLLAQYSQENMAAPVPQPPPPTKPPQTTTKPSESNAKTSAPGTGTNNNTEMPTCSFDYENLDFFKDLIVYVDRNNFPEELYTQMLRECSGAHANVVSEKFQDPVDYAIITCERSYDASKLPVNAKYLVTELYVESCMRENKLMPIEYYHKHIPHTADVQPLKDMTIVISVYANLERDYIDSLAKLLGAKVNETYAKKEQPLLICPEAKGAKYLGALKWRFPVVTSEWLVQCAEQGVKLPLREFLVGESPEEFPSPSRTREITFNEDVEMAPVTTTKDVTPLRNKRVSELATTAAATAVNNNSTTPTTHNNKNYADSPRTPMNACGRAYSFEFMEKILESIEDAADREFVRGIIEDIRANPTPELERIKRQVCTPMNRRLSNSPKAIIDFCNTPEFKRRMAEEFDKRWHLPTKKLKPSTPIDQIRKRVLRETCKSFGIPVSDEEEEDQDTEQNENTTPIGSGLRSNRQTSGSSTSKAQLTPVHHHKSTSKSKIEPRTIFAVATPKLEQRRSTSDDNTFVPCTQETEQNALNTKNSSSSINNKPPAVEHEQRRSSLVGKSTIDFDKISFEETTVNSIRKPSTSNVSPDLKQITDFLKERESKRRSLRNSASAGGGSIEMEGEEVHFVQPFETEQLCGFSEQMVEWRDPIEFNNEKRAMKIRTMQYDGTPRFSISCSDDTLREETIAKILKLGGEVSANLNNFDPECTHFVCERPNRGEKILGCISSGKWVLSIKYIEESHAKDNFIDEELYEWGNIKAINLPSITADEQLIAQACYRWRKELATAETPNAGIFSGVRAILRIGPKTKDSLSNVIKAGKGVVVMVNSPYSQSSDAHLATHCFVDVKKMPLNRHDYDYLREHDVKIASFLYIQAYLINGHKADFSAFEVKI